MARMSAEGDIKLPMPCIALYIEGEWISASAAAIGVGSKPFAPGVPSENMLLPNEKLGKDVSKLGMPPDVAAAPPEPSPLSGNKLPKPRSPPEVDKPMKGKPSPKPASPPEWLPAAAADAIACM